MNTTKAPTLARYIIQRKADGAFVAGLHHQIEYTRNRAGAWVACNDLWKSQGVLKQMREKYGVSPDDFDVVPAEAMESPAYFVGETAGTNPRNWEELPSRVKTLTGAEIAAQNRRMFQHTAAWVGQRNAAGNVVPVAVRHPKGHAMAGWAPVLGGD